MHLFSIAALGTLLFAGTVISDSKNIVEKLNAPPSGWIKDDALTALVDKDDLTIRVRFHMVQQDMDKFHDLAMKIATPGHELYGSHLSQEVINNMIAPKEQSSAVLLQWLSSEGLTASLSPRSDSVIVEASVSRIEALLETIYEAFVNEQTGETIIRTLQYTLPSTLKTHVDSVQPTTFFGLKAMKSSISSHRAFDDSSLILTGAEAVTGCSGSTVTPKCLSNLYSFASATAYTNGLLGIAGFLEEWPIKSDLATFLKKYATEGNSAQTFNCTAINGGECPSSRSPGVEANLDVQYARAITEDIPNVFYSVGGSPPSLGTGTNTNEPYLEFLDYLLALPDSELPNTISISYGDDEDTVPLYYADEVCNLFAQLGARGVSVLVASGDSGVGTTCTSGSTDTFTTSFPASCPWVTTVGGTTGNSPESAWTDSGGGFSSVFGVPSYQNATVQKWLTTDKTHTAVKPYFNASGRAYPDVSAQATDFVITVSGSSEIVDGTSCATPTFASVIQLLNSDRLVQGKRPLGFLNPWLYANATSGLTDITEGSNSGCSGVISGAGFEAVTGWDPATGLGTPIFTKLLALSRAT